MAMMLMGLTDAIVLGQYAPEELAYVLSAWLPIGVSLGFGIGILLGVQVLTALARHRPGGRVGPYLPAGALVAIVMGGVLTAALVPFAALFFHFVFVTIAPASPEAAAAAVTPEHVAASTAAVTRILAYGLIGHMISQACSYYLEALRRPLLVTIVMYVGVVINIFANLALVAGW